MSALFESTVVPVDGSKLAELALEAIAPLARGQHGEVVLVMVMDGHVDQVLSDAARSGDGTVVEAARAYLDQLEADLVERGLAARSRLVFDPVAARGILHTAEEEHATAIVIASHGRSGVGRWLLGSVAHKIVHTSHIPTLVIPAR